jgi:prepilin-type N-terminal cleavage/methylation domain-containing protein
MTRRDRGFTLVEILIALTILSITLGGFAAMTATYVRNVTRMNARVTLAGLVGEQSQRLGVMPFDSLAAHAGCQTFSNSALPHTRCIVISAVNGNRKRVTIIFTPANSLLKPDTVWFQRARKAGNPLCTTC